MKKLLIPAILFISFSTSSALGEVDDIVIFEGDSSNEFIIDGSASDDITLYFGDSLSHFLRWDADRNIFVFSDNVDFGGNQLLDMRIENLANAPVCDVNSSGRLYHNTTNNNSFVCNSSVWKQIDEEVVSGINPYLTSISPSSIQADTTTTLSISGGGFSPDSSVVIPGFTGNIGTVTVVSPSEIIVELIPSINDSGNFDIIVSSNGLTNEIWNGNGVGILEIINTQTLIPGTAETPWERIQDVLTSEGKILPSTTGEAWTQGGSFGTVPANSDFVLSFTPVYMAGQSSGGYAMMGVDNSDPDVNYTSIDYAFYISDGNQLNIYENGESRGSFGAFAIGDVLSLSREGTTIKYLVNGNVVYTSSVPISSSVVFDSSIYRWLGAENISLEY